MKSLKFLFFFLIPFFFWKNPLHSIEKNEDPLCIIYLKGSCSAGKSTFIRSILKEWQDVEVIDEDAIMHKGYVAAIEARFPHEFPCIQQAISHQNLYHAIREKDILFKDNASEEERKKVIHILCMIQEELNRPENSSWKQQVSHSIDLQVLAQIKQAIEQRKIVLLDSWYIKPKHLNLHFPEVKVAKVLLYCPLKKAYDRFMTRNEEALFKGDLSEKRYVRQLIGSFISLYKVSSEQQQAIEQITELDLQDAFSAIASSLKDGPDFHQKPIFTFEEISKPFLLKLQTEFLLPIEKSCRTGAVFYITPKEKYDIVLESTGNSQQLIYLLKKFISG